MLSGYFRLSVVHRQIDFGKDTSMRIGAAYQHAFLIDDERLDHVLCPDNHKLRSDSSWRCGSRVAGCRNSTAGSRLSLTTVGTKHVVGSYLFAAMTAENPLHHRRWGRNRTAARGGGPCLAGARRWRTSE